MGKDAIVRQTLSPVYLPVRLDLFRKRIASRDRLTVDLPRIGQKIDSGGC
jgi:hypothetical protein